MPFANLPIKLKQLIGEYNLSDLGYPKLKNLLEDMPEIKVEEDENKKLVAKID